MFVKHNVAKEFDVFLGKGWDNWTRVRRAPSHMVGVAGNRLSYPTMKEIHKATASRIPSAGLNVELQA